MIRAKEVFAIIYRLFKAEASGVGHAEALDAFREAKQLHPVSMEVGMTMFLNRFCRADDADGADWWKGGDDEGETT